MRRFKTDSKNKKLAVVGCLGLGWMILFVPPVNCASISSFIPHVISSRTDLIIQPSVFTTLDSPSLSEEFSFLIKDFKLYHQGENNNLNLLVRYRYAPHLSASSYPDFRMIAKAIEDLLAHYPNKTDYWEIVNKKLTSLILKKYSVIVSITIKIEVSPTQGDPYTRSSIVTRTRSSINNPIIMKRKRRQKL